MGLLVGFTTEVTEGTEDCEERSAGSSELGSGTFNLGDGADLCGERGALKLFSCCLPFSSVCPVVPVLPFFFRRGRWRRRARRLLTCREQRGGHSSIPGSGRRLQYHPCCAC